MRDKVCAIVVSFNPDISILRNIAALSPQVDEIIIVDNGSNDSSKSYLEGIEKSSTAKIIYNKENLGIAAALNIGVRHAIDSNYDWVVTFDQDSLATPNFIDSMLAAYNACTYKEDVALVSTTYLNPKTHRLMIRSTVADNSSLFAEVNTAITSGSLVKINAFQKIGLFDESFFIDYVDHDFCLRCRKFGYKLIESRKSVITHNLGNQTLHSFLWKKGIITTNHNHFRRYYISRNRIVVYKKYFLSNIKWIIRDIKIHVKDILKIALFEQNARLKLIYITKGTYHGFIGRMGKYT